MRENIHPDTTLLTRVAKSLGYLALFSYSLGFVIHNIYLSNFGFSDFTFLQIKYISTGLFFIVINFPIFYFFVINEGKLTEILKLKSFKKLIRLFVECIILILIYTITFTLIIGRDIFYYEYFKFNLIPSMVNFFRYDVSIIFILNFLLYISVRAMFKKTSTNLEPGFIKILSLIFAPILIFLIMYFFSLKVYASSPSYIGGGISLNAIIETQSKENFYGSIIYNTSDYIFIRVLSKNKEHLENRLIPMSRINSVVYMGNSMRIAPDLEPILFNMLQTYLSKTDSYISLPIH